MSEGDQRLLSAADDDFHMPDGSWWFHETCWFWFSVPDRGIGAWIYNYIRPNIGVAGGGCWVWDGTAHLHWEVPYYANYSNLRLPEERDLRDFAFPSGVRVQALEPLARYRLTYQDREWISFDLVFESTMEPWVRVVDGRPVHLDQFGRVTGALMLHGEVLAVDCLAIRDRTWAVRSERWKHGGGFGYTSAAAETGEAFLAVGGENDVSGFVVLDGRRAELVRGGRQVERDAEGGYVTHVAIEATDSEGRILSAEGRAVNRMAMPVPGVHGVAWTSLVEWTINGIPAWGDDQEPWPIMAWSNRRRTDQMGVR